MFRHVNEELVNARQIIFRNFDKNMRTKQYLVLPARSPSVVVAFFLHLGLLNIQFLWQRIKQKVVSRSYPYHYKKVQQQNKISNVSAGRRLSLLTLWHECQTIVSSHALIDMQSARTFANPLLPGIAQDHKLICRLRNSWNKALIMRDYS